MSDLTHRDQLERRLKDELDEAERQMREAPAHDMPDARQRYRGALQRFSRLVVHGLLPQDEQMGKSAAVGTNSSGD